jgi:hypothetical protein
MTTRTTLILAIVCIAVLAAACSSDDSASPTSIATTTTVEQQVAATTTTTVPPTTTTTLPPNQAADITVPSTATYGHVVFRATDGEYSNATPGSYLDDDPVTEENRYLYIRFTADYEPDYPGRSDQFDVGDFLLLLGDGTTISSELVDFRRSLLLTKDEPLDHAFAFPGTDLDLTEAVIIYDDQIHLPMTIDLAGNASPDSFPVTFDVGETAEVSYEGGCAVANGTATVVDGEWDVDAGVDQDGKTILTAGTARTNADELFVRLKVQAIANNGNCGGTVMTDDPFRLIVDGLPIGPVNRFSTALKDGEGVEIIWGFRVPTDATEVEFEAGLSGETTARFPIPTP